MSEKRKPVPARRMPGQHARPNRGLSYAVSALILALMVVYAKKNGLVGSRQFTVDTGSRPLPEWYAVCSKEGKGIYTLPAEPVDSSDAAALGAVQCVVVGGKTVQHVGSLQSVRRKYGDAAAGVPRPDASAKSGIKVIYLPPGHTLTPGLTDGHAHPLEYGASRALPLQGAKTRSDTVAIVEEHVKTRPPRPAPWDKWVTGLGWDQTQWPENDFPTAADLDTPALKDLMIVLYRTDLHAVWVSPAVLAAIGDIPLEDVEGGHVVRDANGVPTGVFIDNAIRAYVTPQMPEITDAIREGFLETVTRDALSLGLTGVHDAGLTPTEIAFFRRMAAENKLGIRFYTMLLCPSRAEYCGDEVERTIDAQDGRWTLRSVKLFGDGALGSRGAALLEDYADKPGWKGFLLTAEEVWKPLIKRYYDEGWQVNVHCIGDKANHVVLDAIEAAVGDAREEAKSRRMRIEHAQIMTQADLKRAAELGVIGSYQPTHATSDMWYAEDRLGPERILGAYAWRTYLSHGGRLNLGSDFPVESPDPRKGLYAAVARCREDGTSPHGPGGWYPAEKLSRVEALRGFTVDPAYASFSNSTGSLTPGYRFDAVLWDDDYMTVEDRDILEMQAKATILDGRIVYGEWKE